MKKKTKYAPKWYNRHHLLPQSRDGSNEPENIRTLKQTVHNAFHTVFANDTPAEQIKRLLRINRTVLQGDFIQDIERILDLYWEDIYHWWIKKND